MGFEHVNGSFSFVVTVHVKWDKLKCAFVGFFDDKFVGHADFVFQDLLFDMDVVGFERALILLYAGMQCWLALVWNGWTRIALAPA